MTSEAATRVIGRVALARSFRAGEVDCGIVARLAIRQSLTPVCLTPDLQDPPQRERSQRPPCGVIKASAPGGRGSGGTHQAQDFIYRRYRHRGGVDEVERAKNRAKPKVRAGVEHSMEIIKRVFGFAKVCATAG
jgi:hypothetical protein